MTTILLGLVVFFMLIGAVVCIAFGVLWFAELFKRDTWHDKGV
jgi:hypothetical protein